MAAAKEKSVVVKFKMERETKRTVRYNEEGDADKHVVGSLYVQQSALKELGGGSFPQNLSVTIAAS